MLTPPKQTITLQELVPSNSQTNSTNIIFQQGKLKIIYTKII